jgi:DNA-binding MarR family transcriptional regulator
MTENDVLEAYCQALIEFLLLSKRNVLEISASCKLTLMQSMTLLLLSEPRPMHSFTTLFSCDASNITGIIDGLERKQLASRFEPTDDRRIKMVRLEPKGSATRAHFIAKLSGEKSYILSRLTTTEVDTFIKLLNKITKG